MGLLRLLARTSSWANAWERDRPGRGSCDRALRTIRQLTCLDGVSDRTWPAARRSMWRSIASCSRGFWCRDMECFRGVASRDGVREERSEVRRNGAFPTVSAGCQACAGDGGAEGRRKDRFHEGVSPTSLSELMLRLGVDGQLKLNSFGTVALRERR